MKLKNIFITVCIAVLVLSLAGCRTVISSNTLVGVTSSGRVTVGGRIIEQAKLSKKLKSVGYKPSDTIKVSASKGMSPQTMMQTSRVFAAAGFPKIVFIKPREASAIVKADKKKS